MYIFFLILLSIITIYYFYSSPHSLKKCIIQGPLLDNRDLSYVFMEKTYYILNKSKDINHFGIYSYTKLKNNVYILKINNKRIPILFSSGKIKNLINGKYLRYKFISKYNLPKKLENKKIILKSNNDDISLFFLNNKVYLSRYLTENKLVNYKYINKDSVGYLNFENLDIRLELLSKNKGLYRIHDKQGYKEGQFILI